MKRFRKFARSFVALVILYLILACESVAAEEGNPEESIQSQKIYFAVDPRVEIISIVFRLAGNHEYGMCRIPDYQADIDKYFHDYREHPTIKLARELRSDHGITFDAPMSIAVYLEKGFSFKERKSFDDWPWGIDDRWTKEDAKEFLERLRQFSADTDFAKFFNDHKTLYDKAVTSAAKAVQSVDLSKWLGDFFGVSSKEELNIVMAPVNGPGNYGVRFELPDTRELYAIMGVWECDNSGEPLFSEGQLSTVAHEFCHSYVNPIVDANASKLEQAGKKLYSRVEDKMRNQAYRDWIAMIRESVVRVCEVQFVGSAMGDELKEKRVQLQIEMGFLWTKELSELVGEYERQRDKYPTFESFFPEFVVAFDKLSQKDFKSTLQPAR